MIILESFSISRFEKPLYAAVRTESLKAIYCVVIIEVLPKCLLSVTLILTLESLITQPDALILLVFEPLSNTNKLLKILKC